MYESSARLDVAGRARTKPAASVPGTRPSKMRYCARCVYPEIAVFVTLGEDGVCSGCRVNADKPIIDWTRRRATLHEILEEARSKDGSRYDCIIPVSGGKDSYFQAHVIKTEFGMNPLLVTYHGNNYLPEGEENLLRMRKAFGVDHLIFRPGTDTLIKMNRAGLILQGDMNWHAHCGIATYPVQAAVRHKIPLIIWGEHGPTHIGGQHSLNDFVEMNARARKEHYLRGYDWQDFVGLEGLTERELLWARYPSDESLDELALRQIHLGNYVYWDENIHVKLVMERYAWQPARQPFERTYRMFSNLDDMHENGIHDYLKYLKFGYGRATDHASKDVRAGHITRAQGIELVRKHDHVRSSDLARWLDYVKMTEQAFDDIADRFRDPRVWWKDASGRWVKDNIWDAV